MYIMGISETEILQCFKILKLDPEASLDDTQKAFRKIVKIWHPDLLTDNPKLKRLGEEKLKKVNAAYNTIKIYLSSQIDINNISGTTKHYSASAASGTGPDLFPDPFSRLRMGNLKWPLAEYLKSMKTESRSFNFIPHQTNTKPTKNGNDHIKDFKQVLKEVVATKTQTPETNHLSFTLGN